MYQHFSRLIRLVIVSFTALAISTPGGLSAPPRAALAKNTPTINVPPSNKTSPADGACDWWQDAVMVEITVSPAPTFSTFQVYLMHNADAFYVCFSNMPMPQTGNTGFVAVYVDPDNDGQGNDANDFVVLVHPNGNPSAYRWNPATGQYDGADPGGWSAGSALCAELCEWGGAEFRINRQTVGSWRHTIGLSLFYHWYRFTGDDFAWPANNVWANPELWGNATLTIPTLNIPQSGTVPTVDGLCGLGVGSEYQDANVYSIPGGANGGFVDLFIKHTATNFYACMDNLAIPAPALQDGPNAALYVNRAGQGGEFPASDDMAFSISYTGVVEAHRGSGAGFTGPDPGGYSVARQLLSGKWNAEFRVSSLTLGGGWARPIDISLVQQWIQQQGDHTGWPTGYSSLVPITWASAYLDTVPAVVGTDVRPIRIEINQSIQDTSNSVFLIRNKRTFVRVHLSTNQVLSGVTARLSGTINGNNVGPTLVPLNPSGVINVVPAPNTGMVNDSFLFELPSSWITGSGPLVLAVTVNPFHSVTENNYANNSLTSAAFTFLPKFPLNLVDIRYVSFRLNGTPVSPSSRDQDMLESEIRRMYPIRALNVSRRTLTHAGLFLNTCASFPWICLNDLPNAVTVNNELISNRAFFGFGRTLYAMVHDRADGGVSTGSGFMRGMGLPIANVASGPTGPASWEWDFDGAYGDWYGAHEVGHALWRHHTSACSEPIPYQDYPYPEGRLGDAFVGLDAGDGALSQGFRLMPGTIWHDVMSYCDFLWVSDVTYGGLDRTIQSGLPLQADESSQPSSDVLVVNGLINLPHQSAAFASLARQSEASWAPVITPGPYHLRLLGAGDALLADHPFTPEVASDVPEAGAIYLVVNWIAGTQRIAIYSDAAGTEIASVPVSAHPPIVAITTRSGGPNLPVTGPITVGWNASDPDGNPLTFTLQYSLNNQTTWRTLVTGIAANSYVVAASELEGTGGAASASFRVIANDGVLTSAAVSDLFSVAGKTPEVTIASPANNHHAMYGQVVALEGYGHDFEDGTLPDANLTWTSDRDGQLGKGHLLHPALLTVGTHHITLQVVDSNGQTASRTVTVVIGADESQPGPRLEAGPAPLGFLHRFGRPNPAARTLSVRNSGSGTLNWSAVSSAAWVTLSSVSGSGAADIQVSVNALALPPNTTTSAQITLTAAGSSPVVIPVIVQTVGARLTYLPVIFR
jgi:hypothetical protein